MSTNPIFIDKDSSRLESVRDKNNLVIRGKSMNNEKCPVQVGLINRGGDVFGALITLTPELSEQSISFDDLKPVKLVTLPRPYPSFLPYFFEGHIGRYFDIKEVEAIQISIGPGLKHDQLEERYGIGIESVYFDKR